MTSNLAMPVLTAIAMLNFPLGICLAMGVALAHRISLSNASRKIGLSWMGFILLATANVVSSSVPDRDEPALSQLVTGWRVFGAWILPVLCLWYLPTIMVYAACLIV